MSIADPLNLSGTAGTVLVTGTGIVPPEACEFIKDRGYSVHLVEKDNLTDRQLHKLLKGTCGYLIGGEEKPKAEHFEQAEELQVVAWVGTDFRSGAPGWQRAYELGIAVVSTPGENARSVAEFTLLLMLGIARPFTEHVRTSKAEDGDGTQQDPPVGIELYGRTLGIVGAGRIGGLVARAAVHGFGMNVLYAAPRRNEALETELGLEHVALTELLERSDIVSLHRPGLAGAEPPTLGRAELERPRPGALLVNTARPSLVDLDALLWAIEHRHLRAAFDEVGAEGTWARLTALGPDRFLSVPHMGARTREASLRAGMRAARAVCDVLSGQESESVNNPGFRALRHR